MIIDLFLFTCACEFPPGSEQIAIHHLQRDEVQRRKEHDCLCPQNVLAKSGILRKQS